MTYSLSISEYQCLKISKFNTLSNYEKIMVFPILDPLYPVFYLEPNQNQFIYTGVIFDHTKSR